MRFPDIAVLLFNATAEAKWAPAQALVFALALLAVSTPVQVSAQSRAECLACHGERSLLMQKGDKTLPLFVDAKSFEASAHGSLDCVACHEGLKMDQVPHARRIAAVNCLSCHSDEQFTRYAQSIHGRGGKSKKPAAQCSDCHTAHNIQKISEKQPQERKAFTEEICARCHGDIHKKFMKSNHGLALLAGTKGAPTCIDCHGEHEVVSPTEEGAVTGRKNEAAMCMSCHLDNPDVRAKVGPSAGFISSYEKSVHGLAMHQGNDAAATCTDCHGSHEMQKGSDPTSRVAKKNIAATCGQCHGDAREQYDGSIHGQAVARGIAASATCTDCHGEHNIMSPKDTRSPVAPKNVSAQVCSPCHASVKLTSKFGLAGDRFRSYADSYHGLAGRAGAVEVANCASCHGVHDIKPSTDPSSRINKANLVNTCGTCHPGANENFTRGSIHVVATAGRDEVLYLVSTGYIVLILVLIGGMLVHNILDFRRKSKRQLMYRRGIVQRAPVPHRLYLRMSLSERAQHGTLLVSFGLLVITGFALKFPEAWWVVPLRNISPVMFELRGILHRIAGVMLVLVSLYHLYYVFFVPRGKRLVRDLLPVRQDVADLIAVMKYNIGLSKLKPKFGRFSYIEKSEYWALVWGTVVMAATGAILWFDNTFLGLLTKLWWDVARAVHYYEAWLATLAIIVWHFYFVIFNPDSYPLNLAFWKGTLTEEEMEEDHPLELEEIKERELTEEEDERVVKDDAETPEEIGEKPV